MILNERDPLFIYGILSPFTAITIPYIGYFTAIVILTDFIQYGTLKVYFTPWYSHIVFSIIFNTPTQIDTVESTSSAEKMMTTLHKSFSED